MLTDTKILFHPTASHLQEIEAWLAAEDRTGAGFYCNWDIIVKSYRLGKMVVATVGNAAIGFVTWYESERTAAISIAEIHPDCRQRGLGTLIVHHLEEDLARKGIVMILLDCRPAASERFWIKEGFARFPDDRAHDEGAYLYKILARHQQLLQKGSGHDGDLIEVWDKEPYRIRETQPIYRWQPAVDDQTGLLALPIIFPCRPDWQIRWSARGATRTEGKIKHFAKGGIYFGDCAIISSL